MNCSIGQDISEHENNQNHKSSYIALGMVKIQEKCITDFNIFTRPAHKIVCQPDSTSGFIQLTALHSANLYCLPVNHFFRETWVIRILHTIRTEVHIIGSQSFFVLI